MSGVFLVIEAMLIRYSEHKLTVPFSCLCLLPGHKHWEETHYIAKRGQVVLSQVERPSDREPDFYQILTHLSLVCHDDHMLSRLTIDASCIPEP